MERWLCLASELRIIFLFYSFLHTSAQEQGVPVFKVNRRARKRAHTISACCSNMRKCIQALEPIVKPGAVLYVWNPSNGKRAVTG